MIFVYIFTIIDSSIILKMRKSNLNLRGCESVTICLLKHKESEIFNVMLLIESADYRLDCSSL